MNLNHPDTCDELRAAIPLLVGEDLEPPALEAARRHLATCKACVRALGRAQEARGALGSLRAERPAPDVWRTVRAVLLKEGLIDGVLPAPLVRPAASASAAEVVPAARGPRPLRRLAWARPVAAALPVAAAVLVATALWIVATGPWATQHFQGAPGAPGSVPDAGDPPRTLAGAPQAHSVAPRTHPSRAVEGVTLVSNGPGPSALPLYPRRTPAPTARPAGLLVPDCPDPRQPLGEPVALRPSSDQQPRPLVYFQPEGLWVEAIDVRQLRRQVHPLAARPNGGVQAAGGQQ